MGRSKFPGKPSKHVNRKRINVIPSLNKQNNNRVSDDDKSGEEYKQDESSTAEDTNGTLQNDPSVSSPDINRRMSRKRRTITKTNLVLSSKTSLKTKIGSLTQVARSMKTKITKASVMRNFSNRNVPRLKQNVVTQKEGNNIVGKFILPSRSIHSSRVIKPNKRFITVDLSDQRTFKKRIMSKQQLKLEEEKTKIVKCKPKCVVGDKEKERNKRHRLNNSPVSTREQNVYSNGRVVLRQARLQLHNQVSSGPEGPFSNTNNSGNSGSPPGTVTCGVCGAVRFYRFVKQARKFNIYSCESCRKFISKMIKRQTCSKNISVPTLVCHKGQGMCHVPPIVRSQQWKLIRCAYRARCPACWLKMCLRSFQMPAALKTSLMQLLPKNMQCPETLFNSSLPVISWQVNADIKDTTNAPVKNNEPPLTPTKRPVRLLRNTNVSEKVSANTITSDVKRQKVDLKGPRVKHVCRSASIVLGQPIATFPTTNKMEEEKDRKVTSADEKSSENTTEGDFTENYTENFFNETTKRLGENADTNKKGDNSTLIKKERSQKHVSVPHVMQGENKSNSFAKRNGNEVNTISIDFWENYDPDEVCRSGFGLMASEPFSILAICFLCGSAGREELLHCSVCCEPYHTFCLDQSPPIFMSPSQKYDWLCPRCTTCSACDQPDRQKINCQKCHKAYHPECFNRKWISSDKPTVCSKCLLCKSCGSDNITKFIGNLPLCVTCFKLRKKGNFCPLCQKCYDDNDFDSKMMECGKCRKWVHSKCENLTDEQYQILSFLPECVEFMCSLCCKQVTPQWRRAIERELKSSLNNVLRLLSKNRTARNALKLSPVNNNTTNCKVVTSVARKLQFLNESESREINDLYKTSTNETASKKSEEGESKFIIPSMLNIKNKLNSNEYFLVREFNRDMEQVLNLTKSDEVMTIYYTILKKIFPWYDPKEFSYDVLETNSGRMNESFTEKTVSSNNFDDEVIDVNLCAKIDTRICAFCKGVGDGPSMKESRLLYCGQNEWVHANCALWSSEVFEEIDGSLQNVHGALSRGRLIRCAYCKQKGATVGCCFKGCFETFHFACAQAKECKFLHDKTVYCSTHDISNANNSSIIVASSEFDISRLVYVELDKKRKKQSEIDKVQFMVGSLTVTNVGKIVPLLSDGLEAIVPCGFVCSRLFWSTVEPWKLVSYVITTSVANSQVTSIALDRNFTVDHSLSKNIVEKKLKEIQLWQKDLDKNKSDIVESEDDEEPQNTADILSPELTDAILEELPHGLLDGISVQDIFPKLMSYEDLLNMDLKSTDYNNTSEILNGGNEFLKKSAEAEEIESYMHNKCDVDVKKSKTDVCPNEKVTKAHSCSLTLSCKLDTSLTPAIKKRKIASRDNGVYFQLLQVDGAYDSSSSSECGSPLHEPDYKIEIETNEEPVTCDRCQCTYRTCASYKRHLETCEVMSISESDSECSQNDDLNRTADSFVEVENNAEKSTIVNYAFQQTTETARSGLCEASVLNAHQTFVTSESKSQLIAVAENVNQLYSVPTTNLHAEQDLSVSLKQTTTTSAIVRHPILETNYENNQTFSVNPTNANLSLSSFSENQNVSLCLNSDPVNIGHSVNLNIPNQLTIDQSVAISKPAETIHLQQPVPINQQPVELQPQTVAIHPVPFVPEVAPVNYISQPNHFTIDAKMLTGACPNIINSVVTQTLTLPQGQWVKPIIKPTLVAAQKNIKSRGRPRSLAAKRTKVVENGAVLIPTSSNSLQPVIVQHIPSSHNVVVPTFTDSLQQQGQNFQYVTNIAPSVNPTSQIVQIQPENNFINVVPAGVQPTVIIQQPQRLVADQLVVDSNGSLAWATAAPQPIQPVYFGFETIVQNTVMQSQQFLPTTVPGLLTANSSYSATTQVFQTSKLEPVLDVAPNSFLLFNSGQLVNTQPVQISQISQQINPPTVTNVVPLQKPSVWRREPIVQPSAANTAVITEHLSIPSTVNVKPTNCAFIAADEVSVPTPKVSVSSINYVPATVPEKCRTPFEQKPQTLSSTTGTVSTMTTTTTVSSSNTNSITLPTAPFIPEQGVPTNIVAPTPKVSQTRPMSRVLPMQTNIREIKKPKEDETKTKKPDQTIAENANIAEHDAVVKPCPVDNACNDVCADSDIKTENTSLKLIFQKQSQDGVYKISNSFSPKQSSIQVAPLKPMKSKSYTTQTNGTTNYTQNLVNEKSDTVNNKTQQVKTQVKSDTENSSILYTIETKDGFRYTSTSICDLWTKVFEAVQAARSAHNMSPLPSAAFNMINNLQVLGLKTNGLKYLIEQLPGAGKCLIYKPTFNFASTTTEDDDILMGHFAGAIKCVPYTKRSEANDMFGWLASKHRKPESNLIDSDLLPRRGSVTNLPMAMRFRQLKLTSKKSVGVYRSGIHRRGLFCLRDIEPGEMVIEYAGEVIRSILTDKREKYYNSKGIGCYMFKIDDNLVVDATMKGNAARFINHSCDPNCYSKVVEILGHKHIIIFALRRILCGEELTYDYKFPFEEDKIPCTCGARRCRKFLN